MKDFLLYLEAISVARFLAKKFDIISETKWRRFSKSKNMPSGVPVCPDKFYKNCGWVSWGVGWALIILLVVLEGAR